jgi:hypothetical protein
VEVQIHTFFNSALVGDESSASRPGCFTPRGEKPNSHWIGGLMDPIASLDDVEKRKILTLPGLELFRAVASHYSIRYLVSLLKCTRL